MPSRYDVFAPFYDGVMGDRTDTSAYVRSLVERHRPGAATVLELACGTGSVLKYFGEEGYAVAGIDRSEQMLEIARRKVPQAQLLRRDITRFRVPGRFDAVLCVYDSINHVIGFERWRRVFDRARAHLVEDGVFVFDINTERRLAELVSEPTWVRWFDENLVLVDVVERRDGVVWELRIFERTGPSNFELHCEDIPEVSYPAETISATLRESFSRVWIYDRERKRASARSGRLYFVCRA
jgi:SAM-dependent methyltransferase